MTFKKEIVYPVFLDCVQYATDIYWKQVFEDLAYGITPYGIYFNKGFLCCNFKNKEFSYKIETKNPETIFNEIYNILKNKVGILSSNDKLFLMEDFKKIENEIKENQQNKWNNIKKRTTKDFIIENYVIDMKNQHNLTSTDAKRLLNLIQIGLVFKTINLKNMKYENGKLLEISIFSFENGKFYYNNIIDSSELLETKILFVDKLNISTMWKKYHLSL